MFCIATKIRKELYLQNTKEQDFAGNFCYGVLGGKTDLDAVLHVHESENNFERSLQCRHARDARRRLRGLVTPWVRKPLRSPGRCDRRREVRHCCPPPSPPLAFRGSVSSLTPQSLERSNFLVSTGGVNSSRPTVGKHTKWKRLLDDPDREHLKGDSGVEILGIFLHLKNYFSL